MMLASLYTSKENKNKELANELEYLLIQGINDGNFKTLKFLKENVYPLYLKHSEISDLDVDEYNYIVNYYGIY